ncbi:MAG: SpoIIE family protein phosphatase [Clostridia bacterium]|nr:SpoIIE family protein phosphatase [Clostridia bacterium]
MRNKRKRNTLFYKTIAIILPIVLVTNLIVLALAYYVTYQQNYNHCAEDVTKAARVIEDFVGMYDLTKEEDVKQCNESISALCREFEITYAYVVRIDVEKNTETYVTLGAGHNASETYIKERYPGYVVKGCLNQEQIDVVGGKENYAVVHEVTKIDDTITCYVPLMHVYDPKLNTFVETEKSTGCLVGAEVSFQEMVTEFRNNLFQVLAVSIVLSTLMVLVFATVLRKKISNPAQAISRQMKSFVAGKKGGMEKMEETKGITEYTDMVEAFNTMVDEINQYVGDIENLSKQKHMAEAEMNIARNIHLGLLPPPAYSDKTANIDAFVLPAREVGGDFYAYQIIPDGIFFAVADVSGKGVSAALFVSRALTLLHMYASLGYSPTQAMADYNNTLAQNNPGKLFITTFMGIYKPAERTITYTNAGHNVPYLLKKDGIVPLDDAVGMAAGVFPDAEYESVTVTLEEGDLFFAYTDGVNEAQNKNGEFFGMPALEEILREHTGENRKFVIADVLEAVKAFSDGADQSDDITLFTLKTAGSFYHKELHVEAQVQNLVKIQEIIDQIPDISKQMREDLCIMAEEIFVNECSYAYEGKQGYVDVKLNVAERIELTFMDSGSRFNPTRNMLDIEDYDHEHTVGGLGIFITFNLADEHHYSYENGKNILTLIKNLPHGEQEAPQAEQGLAQEQK